MKSAPAGFVWLAVCLFALPQLFAADATENQADEVAAGHSYHGEAFDEGPRQAAQIMEGMAEIRFPTSAKGERAQKFVEQGIAQLHGFWYLEAERSFRQAAAEESELAIAYWGMAMANVNNRDRARGLIAKAMELRSEGTTPREQKYIEALDRYLGPAETEEDDKENTDDKEKKEKDTKEAKRKRAERFLADLEQILHDHPDDIEAKALLAVHLWMFEREGVSIPSRYAVDALLGEVFAAQPMHPAHHYRIHLWDIQRPENALDSAARCGPAMPAVAHMWHMPGHIYSRLHRYADAAWQQEASARVDHAHMVSARLMPDQIHNFAHNNEWLTRNLIHVGRVQDALAQARNLVSLPRHPKYNSMQKGGSFKYGHERLLGVLTTYGLWQQLIDEAEGPYLSATGDEAADRQRTAWLAVAHHMADDSRRGGAVQRSLQRQHLDLQLELLDIQDAQDTRDASGEESQQGEIDQLKSRIESFEPLLARIDAAVAAVNKDKAAFERHAEAAKLDRLLRAQWLARAGDTGAAVELATQAVNEGEGEVPPLAVLVDLLWQQGNQEEAKKRFADLQRVACDADLETPLLKKLAPVAEAAGAAKDWRTRPEPPKDLGERPPLDQLGPFRWQPYTAPSWQANDAQGEVIGDDQFAGRPRIVIFYLGFGCLHCVEQLHAFAPQAEAFQKAGIELVAISTESLEQLQLGLKNFDEQLPIPLLANPDHEVFKSYRCWDDFEQQPLHGTFLIDAAGRVRWQDIGHEPFNDAEFVLEEAKRLLALPTE